MSNLGGDMGHLIDGVEAIILIFFFPNRGLTYQFLNTSSASYKQQRKLFIDIKSWSKSLNRNTVSTFNFFSNFNAQI